MMRVVVNAQPPIVLGFYCLLTTSQNFPTTESEFSYTEKSVTMLRSDLTHSKEKGSC
jgi:hypothetical protein